MNETYSTSKLKRKRPSTGNMFHPETCSRDTQAKPLPTLLYRDTTGEAPGSVWWSREQLSAEESLWASTLKSALLHLDQDQDQVPDLPPPSTARPAAPQVDQHWCDLREEVAPLPEPVPPSPETPLIPDPLSVRSPRHDVALQSRPEPPRPLTSDAQTSIRHKKSQDGSAASLQDVTRTQQPSLHSRREVMSSSAGPSRVTGGRQKDTEAGPRVRRQILNYLVKKTGNKEQVVKDKEEEEEEQGSVRGDEGAAAAAGGGGGGRLQSCPMCLLVFPPGFTQMDCDGHLAQCLSEMNMDMTW